MVSVFSKPACPQCEATKRFFTKHEVPFKVIDISEDPSAIDFIKKLNSSYSSLPVVLDEQRSAHWSGMNMSELIATREANKVASV